MEVNNPQKIAEDHQPRNGSNKASVAESFLRSSNKLIECDKCREMIPFQKLDIHEIICKGGQVECLYCAEKIAITSINFHEIVCSERRKIQRQQIIIKNQTKVDVQVKPEKKIEENKEQEKPIEKKEEINPHVYVNEFKKDNIKVQRKVKEVQIKPNRSISQKRLKTQQKVQPKIQKPKVRKVQVQRKPKVPTFANQQRPIAQYVPPKPNQNRYVVFNYRNPQHGRNNEAIRRNTIPVVAEEIPFIPPEPKAKNPLTETKIGRLPRVNYQQDEENGEKECSICFMDFQENEELVQFLGCEHMFHYDCIAMWLKNDNRCPNCRQEVKVPAKK